MKRKGGLADSPFFQPSAATVFQSPPATEKQPAVKAEPTRKQVHKNTSTQVNKYTSKHVYMYTFLSGEEGKPTSFRLPPRLMEKFDDIFYQANRQYKTGVKRYAIVVAALALFFWDFEQHGKESDFYKLLIEDDPTKRP